MCDQTTIEQDAQDRTLRERQDAKRCHCAAHNSDECVCGAWADMDPIMLRNDLATARAELATVRTQLAAVTRERELVITDRKRVESELHEAMQPHFRDSSIATLRTALHKQDATLQDYQRRLAASEAARVAAEQDAARLREALQLVRRDICGCDTDDYCDYCGVVNHQPHSRSCVSRTIDAALAPAADGQDAGTEGGGK